MQLLHISLPFLLLPQVSEKVHACLDTLRSQKAEFEKSDADFMSPYIAEGSLLELKQLTLMHTPASVNDEAREKFRSLVELALKGLLVGKAMHIIC